MTVRMAEPGDLKALYEHNGRHDDESGQDGDLIFHPMEGSSRDPYEEFSKARLTRWSTPVTSKNWERIWVAIDGPLVVGELKLLHQPPIPTSLHRATLMMGIERAARGKGVGAKLMTAAISWAKEQPTLDWIQLFVFAHNLPALALYRKFGFVEQGLVKDLFRIHGQSVDDIPMSLKLR